MKDITVGRPIKINGMAYGPTNEQGVVFLFGRLAPRLGFHIESVQNQFPDCVARRRGKECRIEFEFRASSYSLHRHSPRGADVIVCWDNDWDHRPRQFRHLEIIDLKKYTGALPRIFVVGCDENVRGSVVDKRNKFDWSVPTTAQVGDLILMYRTKPASEIRDLWSVAGPFCTFDDGSRGASIKRVARLNKPLTYKALKSDLGTRHIGVVRKQFIGKTDITDDWPLLRAMIVQLNPKTKNVLRQYHFE